MILPILRLMSRTVAALIVLALLLALSQSHSNAGEADRCSFSVDL